MTTDNQARKRKFGLPTLDTSQRAVTFSRDFMIVFLFLLLLVFPAFINDRLVDAGFEEGSFAGLRWKTRVERSSGELTEAKAQLGALRLRLKVTEDSLNAIQSRDPQVAVPNLALIRRENARVAQISAASIRSIQQTISTNDQSVRPSVSAAGDDGRWVVIFGGDSTLDAAAPEIARARRRGIPDPTIIRRQGSFRSVSILPDREAARTVLSTARRSRADAYAVRLASWCPRLRDDGAYGVCD